MSAALPDTKTRAAAAAEKFGHWDDGAKLKNMQSSARRTAKALMTALAEFSELMTPAEREALSTAQSAMRRLGDDFEVAARIAKKAHDKRHAESMERYNAELDRQAEEYFGGRVTCDTVVAACQDMMALTGIEGSSWFQDKHPGAKTYTGLNCHVSGALLAYIREPSLERFAVLQRQFVEGLHDLRYGGFSRFQIWSPTRDDFEEFRRFRAAKAGAGVSA